MKNSGMVDFITLEHYTPLVIHKPHILRCLLEIVYRITSGFMAPFENHL